MRSLLMLAMMGSLAALAAANGAAVKAASTLPEKAQALRDKGLDAAEVETVLKAARDAKLTAGDAATLLDGAAPLVEEHGPIENFGAFVTEKLEAGVRGEELAAAIKAEHEGKGTPKEQPKPTTAAPDPRPGSQMVKPAGKVRPGGPGRITRPKGKKKGGGR